MVNERMAGRLADIAVDSIEPNEDNPRLSFRQGELEELQESIRQYGVQVPISVFKRGARYVLIDGERRWRCARKLNLRTIPALVQAEPGPLENLLLMFNIHALREQWDLLTIALKLPNVRTLLRSELGRIPTESELAVRTGLSRSVIRRCRLLMDLPRKYHELLLKEQQKPKSKQTLSEDLFIEIEKSLTTVMRALPDLVTDRDEARQALLAKYQSKVVDNIVDFRKVGKIARSPTVGVDEDAARSALGRLLYDPTYSIGDAWDATVSDVYAERDVVFRIEHLIERLAALRQGGLDDEIREKLEELIARARAVLETDE